MLSAMFGKIVAAFIDQKIPALIESRKIVRLSPE
jgi:hypothetical protein